MTLMVECPRCQGLVVPSHLTSHQVSRHCERAQQRFTLNLSGTARERTS